MSSVGFQPHPLPPNDVQDYFAYKRHLRDIVRTQLFTHSPLREEEVVIKKKKKSKKKYNGRHRSNK
tara:strand:+ start:301 stop:498 length:198 start_codon:yes stop_codon:yes gene_type:complete